MIATLLLIAGMIAVVLSVPQLIQLVKIKNSDELNLFSWIVWFIYQVIALSYSISINALPYALINTLWIIFYAVMVFLIIKYRPKASRARTGKRKKR
jgi:uncharacterized protein with PQ loop repeat